MQNSVMFGMLLTLLDKRRVSRKFLAEKFELSERTVSRYMDAMAGSGIPLYSLRGPQGGYTLSDDFTIANTYFTREEMDRLFSCVKAGLSAGDGLSEMLIDKLKNVAGHKNEQRFLLSNDWLVIDSGTWNKPGAVRSKIDVINRAIVTNKALNLQYIDRHETKTHRLLDPYYLVLKEGVWYTYGWCHIRADFRLFKLARIRSIFVTEQSFVRKTADVYEKLKGMFHDSPAVDIEFEFSSTVLGEIEEWLGVEAVTERGYKYVAAATLFEGSALLSKLLSFGSSIKILSPAHIREEVLLECRRVIRYAES
ncbi:MAG: YafY family transcriptional regulator [Clostridiales bacterium]|jgi:predicted DNA-binding transcriptional regulator YafY|nr:YafY family transcriptional regulator [Clostridiales bacterium]